MIGATGTPDKVDLDDVTTCFVCGCTDEVACPGGCWWAANDEDNGLEVCNRCVELRDDLIGAGMPMTLEQLAERTGEERDEAADWARATDPHQSWPPEWLRGLA